MGPKIDPRSSRPKLIVLNEPSFVTMKDVAGGAAGRVAMEGGFSTDGGGVVNGVDLVPCYFRRLFGARR